MTLPEGTIIYINIRWKNNNDFDKNNITQY